MVEFSDFRSRHGSIVDAHFVNDARQMPVCGIDRIYSEIEAIVVSAKTRSRTAIRPIVGRSPTDSRPESRRLTFAATRRGSAGNSSAALQAARKV
jgi:hypothetical protein